MNKPNTLRTLAQLPFEKMRQLTLEEVKDFLIIAQMEKDLNFSADNFNVKSASEILNHMLNDSNEKMKFPNTMQVIIKRLAAATPTFNYSCTVLLLASSLCRSFGDCTLWSHTIAIESQRKGKTLMVADFVKLFPIGVPIEEGMQELWLEQKDGGSNLLDKATSYYL
jgi:hypothetical protein